MKGVQNNENSRCVNAGCSLCSVRFDCLLSAVSQPFYSGHFSLSCKLCNCLDVQIIDVNRLMKIKEWVDKNDPGAILIPFSGVFENKLADMEPDEKAKYVQDNGTTR